MLRGSEVSKDSYHSPVKKIKTIKNLQIKYQELFRQKVISDVATMLSSRRRWLLQENIWQICRFGRLKRLQPSSIRVNRLPWKNVLDQCFSSQGNRSKRPTCQNVPLLLLKTSRESKRPTNQNVPRLWSKRTMWHRRIQGLLAIRPCPPPMWSVNGICPLFPVVKDFAWGN